MKILVVLAIAACGSSKPADDGPCTCTPGNVSQTKVHGEDTPMDGKALVARLRHHKQLVQQNTTPRDIKVFDDELRFAIVDFCQPCSDWVKDRLTMEDMFPLDRLGDATGAVCMGLVLRDGTTAYGDARPRACR